MQNRRYVTPLESRINLLTTDAVPEKKSFSFFPSSEASPSAYAFSTTSTGRFLKSGGGKFGLASTLLLIALIFGTYGYLTNAGYGTSPSQAIVTEQAMGVDQQASILSAPMVQSVLTQPAPVRPPTPTRAAEAPKAPSCAGTMRGGFCVLN